MKKFLGYTLLILMISSSYKGTCAPAFVWGNANVYFLLTDRFCNADTSNDVNFNRTEATGKLRNFQGGDLQGVTQKIKEGYFDRLGITALWLSPVVEQVHGRVDEGQGGSYGFHGYWTKDWTALDPNFGTTKDLQELVKTAHQHGIRVLLDAVLNHTGPVTAADPAWPNDWVRTEPTCDYKSYQGTVSCTLVKNLPDVRTESDSAVSLPPALIAKWKKEGRYDQEVKELDEFFAQTGYPRAPRFYIMKWLSDYVRKYGIDGYRVDTAKHVEASVWAEFKKICQQAFDAWKKEHPSEVLDNNEFYTIGEVYGYGIQEGLNFHYPDTTANFYANGFNALINFSFIYNADQDYESLFSSYSRLLNKRLNNYSVLNYLSSHDDGHPYDPQRLKGYEAANKLLLAPGMAQIYYGDESNRSLVIPGTKGDATLRSNMNWDSIAHNAPTQTMLLHWQKLGQFRKLHPAIGAGVHQQISKKPYTFSRILTENNQVLDEVVIALNVPSSEQSISVKGIFKEGEHVHEFYSNQQLVVHHGKVKLSTPEGLALLERVAKKK